MLNRIMRLVLAGCLLAGVVWAADEMTDKVNGKVMTTRQIKVSADLKDLTMTVHPTGQRMPHILVFDRE